MKGNVANLTELAKIVEKNDKEKIDLLAPANKIEMTSDSHFSIDNRESLVINDYAHGQIASAYGIPKAYYDSMRNVKDLRAYNVNAWLQADDKKRLVRTLDGKVRAFLSDRFRPYDNFMVLSAFLPALQSTNTELKVRSASITDTKLFLQVTFPSLQAEIKPGDVVEYGVTLSNSEVGAGSVDIKSFLLRLVCLNGAIRESILRQYHVGKRLDNENMDIFANETIQLDIKAYEAKMRDVLVNALQGAQFEDMANKLKKLADMPIDRPSDTVKNVTKRFGFSENDGIFILDNMAKEGNVSRYGIFNGITALAHHIESPERAYEIEKIGGQIITLPETEWKTLVA
jgi:hypothetical protein